MYGTNRPDQSRQNLPTKSHGAGTEGIRGYSIGVVWDAFREVKLGYFFCWGGGGMFDRSSRSHT